MSDRPPSEDPLGQDPLDRDIAAGFQHLKPSENLMTILVQAAQPLPRTSPFVRWGPTALLVAAAAAVVGVVLNRGLAPQDPVETPASAQEITIPAGMRAVSLEISWNHVSTEDLGAEASVDLLFFDGEQTKTLLKDQLVIANDGDVGRVTFAVTPSDAEALLHARMQGLVVPIVRREHHRLVTVPVDHAAIDAGIVAPGGSTDVLLMSTDGDVPETMTLVQDARVHRVHEDGRVTLSVNDMGTATRLVHGSLVGLLSLSLRGR